MKRLSAVMAIWAIAWAGSKPFASLADGLLANYVGLRWTGLILAIPALVPFAVMILMPEVGRRLADSHRVLDQPVGAPAALWPSRRQNDPQPALVFLKASAR
jgi:hypothetical protein